ncbi:MAG TPA: hypothetical protein VGW77_22045 [Candidatus Binatia bacterium]|nr:hypothetical protein [Candidatus Binatia bacterium]
MNEETQKNDLDIVRLVTDVKKDLPIRRAYNFSFVAQVDKELTKSGWRP